MSGFTHGSGYTRYGTGGTAAQWSALAKLASAYGWDTGMGGHGKRVFHAMGPWQVCHWLAVWAFCNPEVQS